MKNYFLDIQQITLLIVLTCTLYLWASAISKLIATPLKLGNQFTYHGKNTSSTEKDFTICIGETWTAINKLMTMKKSYLSNKTGILLYCSRLNTIVWLIPLDFNELLSGVYKKYINTLPAVLNKSWQQQPTNQQL